MAALWMAAEMHRQKDLTPQDPLGRFVVPKLDDPEGRDLAGAIWLTISPNLEGRSVSSAVKSALVDAARENKVPTAFFYGKNDGSAANLTLNYLNAIRTSSGKKVELKETTGEKAIPTTDLTGSKLLGERLKTTDFIIGQLSRVMDDRGSKEWKNARRRSRAISGRKADRPCSPRLSARRSSVPSRYRWSDSPAKRRTANSRVRFARRPAKRTREPAYAPRSPSSFGAALPRG